MAVLLAAMLASCSSTEDLARQAREEPGRHAAALSEPTGSMSVVRSNHSATPLEDGRVLVAGGKNSDTLASAELYSPQTGTFTLTAPMPEPRAYHAAVRLTDGRVLVVGGAIGSATQAQALLYTPSTGTWSTSGSLATGRTSHTATRLNDGRVLVVGGVTGTVTDVASTELYNPTTGTWTAGPPLPSTRRNHSATLLPNGKVLVTGGVTGDGASNSLLFDPASNSWQATGTPITKRAYHVAFPLADGRVLVVGGQHGTSFAELQSAEAYTPSSGTWAAVGDMSQPRHQFDGVVLGSGAVLVFGGYNAGYIAGVERFDPATGTWSSLDPLLRTRGNHRAVLISGDRALIMGGYGDPTTTEAELYTAGTCVPTTCQTQGKTCGTISDGCGGTLACGSCPTGESCSASNVCQPASSTTTAVYDAARRAPACAAAVSACSSGTLLVGRGPLGPEPGAPNTLGNSCADGSSGTFHSDESLDRLSVSTLDGTALAAGKQVRVEAGVWNFGGDLLDVYVAPDADAATLDWRFVATLTPASGSGTQTLSLTTTLPATGGTAMAVRGVFRYGGTASGPCVAGSYNDHDDLVFAVGSGAPTDAPPSVQLTAPIDGSRVSGQVMVEASASDDNGVARVDFYVNAVLVASDDLAPFIYDWDTLQAVNGTYALEARAYDASGQAATSPAVEVNVVNDREAPTVSVTRPSAGSANRSFIQLEASAYDDVGVTQMEALVDGAPVASQTYAEASPAVLSTYWNSALVADGTHTLVVRVRDASGKVTDSAPVQFVTDNTGPTVAFTSPAPGTVVSGVVTFGVDAADPRGVSRVDLLRAGSVVSWTSTSPYALTWDSRPAAPGKHTFTARGVDSLGNQATSVALEVEVAPDTEPPTVALTSPSQGATVSGTVSVTFTASDDRYLSEMGLYVDGVWKSSVAGEVRPISWDTTAYANGMHRVAVRVKDPGGNVTESAVDVVVDNPVAQPVATAAFDGTRRAPGCAMPGAVGCDSGSLLTGRGPVGPESNAPNTLAGSCADGTAGTFHSDESLDRLVVKTTDGTPLARGKTVRVEATVWAWGSGSSDALDLYVAADAATRQWVRVTTLVPPGGGQRVLSTTFTLPSGATVQAIRGVFRYGGSAGPCVSGSFNDHDDLFFAVQ